MNDTKKQHERMWRRWAKAGAVNINNSFGQGNGVTLCHVYEAGDIHCQRCGQQAKSGLWGIGGACSHGRGWDCRNKCVIPWIKE